MPALRTIHLCQWNFADTDIRVVNTELDGGTSLSGLSENIYPDGGGYWRGDWTGADFGGPGDDDRAAVLSWRAMQAGLSGGVAINVRFCDRHHQPVYGTHQPPSFQPPPLTDESEYVSIGAEASVLSVVNGQAGGLNATIIDIAIASERPLIGGERFTYVHPTWGERCAEIISVEDISGGKRVKFQPPIRGGIAVGDPLDFDNPRCRMIRASQATNALNMGLWATASLTMVEDMRPPE